MKHFYLSFFVWLLVSSAVAQTRTTVANGNATNPLTWDCTCIPLPGQTIVVNHQLVLDNDFAYSSGSITVNAGASITGNSSVRGLAVNGGFFLNRGTVQVANLYHGAGSFTNEGVITIANYFGVDNAAVAQNQGMLTVNDSLLINSGATLNNSGTIQALVTANAGTFTSTGNVDADYFWTSGTVNYNSGTFAATNLYNAGVFHSHAPLSVANDLYNAEDFMNHHDLHIGHSLYIGDSTGGPAHFTNDGLVSVAQDLYNSRTLDGSGRICVGQQTVNSGTISGTLDICDLTGGSIDLNSGTIAGTVTFCAVSCAVSTDEIRADQQVLVYPNPFTNRFEIRTEKMQSYNLILVNATGQQVLDTTFYADRLVLDASRLPEGVYFYRLTVESGRLVNTGRLIKH